MKVPFPSPAYPHLAQLGEYQRTDGVAAAIYHQTHAMQIHGERATLAAEVASATERNSK